MAQSFLEFILRRYELVFAAIIAITLPAVWVLFTAELAPSIVESFVDDPRQYYDAQELESQFIGNPDSIIWLASCEDESLFTDRTLRAIRAASDDISQLPQVARVVALPDVPRPTIDDGGLRGTAAKVILNSKLKQGQVPSQLPTLSPILPANSRSNDQELEAIKRALLQSNGQANRLLSADGRSQVMLIEVIGASTMPPGEQVALVEQLFAIAESHGLGGCGLHCAGLIPLQAYAFAEVDVVLKWLLPIGGVLISLAVMFVFRRVEVILITLLIAAIAVCWGLALGILAFGKISILMAAVPLMVLVISTADVIHLISAYTAEMASGCSHDDAVRKTYVEVGEIGRAHV